MSEPTLPRHSGQESPNPTADTPGDSPDESARDSLTDSTRSAVSRDALRLESGPRWIAPAALALSVLAAIGAGIALFRPAPAPGGVGPSDDPKGQACSAFETVSRAVSIQTKRGPGPDLGPMTPVAAEAIAANARLSMAGGASYLLEKLPSNAPKDLAEQIRSFATNLNGLAINALAGVPNDKEPQAGLLKSVEDSNKEIAKLCE